MCVSNRMSAHDTRNNWIYRMQNRQVSFDTHRYRANVSGEAGGLTHPDNAQVTIRSSVEEDVPVRLYLVKRNVQYYKDQLVLDVMVRYMVAGFLLRRSSKGNSQQFVLYKPDLVGQGSHIAAQAVLTHLVRRMLSLEYSRWRLFTLRPHWTQSGAVLGPSVVIPRPGHGNAHTNTSHTRYITLGPFPTRKLTWPESGPLPGQVTLTFNTPRSGVLTQPFRCRPRASVPL